jgi:hypothetical protein
MVNFIFGFIVGAAVGIAIYWFKTTVSQVTGTSKGTGGTPNPAAEEKHTGDQSN